MRELDNLGFMESVSASLTNLLSLPSKEIKCVESIVFSSFNPPPGYRRFSSFLGNFTCYIALSNVMNTNVSLTSLSVENRTDALNTILLHQAFWRLDLFGCVDPRRK